MTVLIDSVWYDNHFPFLPEDAWKKKHVEEARRAIIARLQYERSQRINSLISEYGYTNDSTSTQRGSTTIMNVCVPSESDIVTYRDNIS